MHLPPAAVAALARIDSDTRKLRVILDRQDEIANESRRLASEAGRIVTRQVMDRYALVDAFRDTLVGPLPAWADPSKDGSPDEVGGKITAFEMREDGTGIVRNEHGYPVSTIGGDR